MMGLSGMKFRVHLYQSFRAVQLNSKYHVETYTYLPKQASILMKLKDLFEHRTATVTIDTDAFNKDCAIALAAMNRGVVFYRGIKGATATQLHADSSQFVRSSIVDASIFNELLDNRLSSWKDYPKRSKSFICTTDIIYTEPFGPTYNVYPVGDPLIAICPKGDIYDGFSHVLGAASTNSFSQQLKLVINTVNQITPIQSISDFIKIMNIIWSGKNKKILAILKILGYASTEEYLTFIFNALFPFNFSSFKYYYKKHSSFYEFLDTEFSPKSNDFKLIRLSNLSSDDLDGSIEHEVWFSGPAYFIKIDM